MSETPFAPRIAPSPSNLTPPELLAGLPEHYLKDPTASNYVAIGVMYSLMGLASQEDLSSDSFIDRVLTGVFTALNDQAASLGYPAFEPPTPLEHPASTRIARLIDAEINASNAGSMTKELGVQSISFLFNYLFGAYPDIHSASLKQAGLVSHAIDYVRESTGKAFPVSHDQGGTWDYDALVHKRLNTSGIRTPELKEEFISWMIVYKLQPSSQWVLKCDDTKGNLGANFVKFLPRFISDFKGLERTKSRDGQAPILDDELDLLDVYAGDSVGQRPTVPQDDIYDGVTVLSSFQDYLKQTANEYHSDGPSLVRILELLLQDFRPREIREELGMGTRDYASRYSRIFEAGKDFKRSHPEFKVIFDSLST